eukprot:TRINITY_DN34373_c0_g1_i1.p2 TRINITY_DN34373_c0_g1~~TRINITY_DN34373_c0_g1_i1.p2  ORF type:complete len:310 (+),score=67.29 TRINITY_DN34373_c0_g1_i1:84-1013(+)
MRMHNAGQGPLRWRRRRSAGHAAAADDAAPPQLLEESPRQRKPGPQPGQQEPRAAEPRAPPGQAAQCVPQPTRLDPTDGEHRTFEEFLLRHGVGADFTPGEELWDRAEATQQIAMRPPAGAAPPRAQQLFRMAAQQPSCRAAERLGPRPTAADGVAPDGDWADWRPPREAQRGLVVFWGSSAKCTPLIVPTDQPWLPPLRVRHRSALRRGSGRGRLNKDEPVRFLTAPGSPPEIVVVWSEREYQRLCAKADALEGQETQQAAVAAAHRDAADELSMWQFARTATAPPMYEATPCTPMLLTSAASAEYWQ